LDKVQEIKRLTAQIGTIKNEMAKYDEQLEDCKKYKEFLDKLTPPEWFEQIKAKKKVFTINLWLFEIVITFSK
jgi:cell shape-determining protein MreC